MKILIYVILSCLYMNISKNIVFPFKKMTIKYSDKTKTINDFIKFSIYTNITMGTPLKNVANFILKGNYEFSFLEIAQLIELNYVSKEIENTLDIFYSPANSSSFEAIDTGNSKYSDIFYFNDFNNKSVSKKLNFIMYRGSKNKLVGLLDIYNSGDLAKIYLMILLKAQDLISGYYMTFIYDTYNQDDIYNYFSDDYNKILGNLILGDSPHEFNQENYKKEDEIKIKGDFNLLINEIKFITKISNFTKSNVNLDFNFNSEFIQGTLDYKSKIDDYFFSDLIYDGICRMGYYQDNIYHEEKIIYSCLNNGKMREELIYFPTLYLKIIEYNLTFLFNYKELFKIYNGRFYFLICFKSGNNNYWEMGEIFLRKYTTSFNYDTKTILFYKTQINNINKITDIPIPEKNQDDQDDQDGQDGQDDQDDIPTPTKSSSSSNTGTIVGIVVPIAIAIIAIIALVCICKK